MVGNKAIIEMLETALCRFSFLECLDDVPKDKRTLVDELDCSRSTVNRGIRKLESLDLVEYVDGGYRLSSMGGLVAADLADLAETVELQLQYEPFLKWMPEDTFDLDLKHLRDAELLLPKEGDPYAMINPHIRRLDNLENGKFLLPYVGMHAGETVHARVIEHSAKCELVVSPAVWNTFQSDPRYTSLVKDMFETGRLEVHLYEGGIAFTLALFEDLVQILVDEEGEPRSLVESDSPAVRDWVASTFKGFKKEAEQLVELRDLTAV